MAIWHVAPLRFAPAFRALGVCEHIWLRYKNFDPSCFDPIQKFGMSTWGLTLILDPVPSTYFRPPLRKKAVKWIMGNKQTCYANSLRLLNILPLPMFVQMNDPLLFSSLTRGNLANILNLHTKVTSRTQTHELSNENPPTERSRSEFFFKNSQIVNKVNNCFDIGNGTGLKDSLLCDVETLQ